MSGIRNFGIFRSHFAKFILCFHARNVTFIICGLCLRRSESNGSSGASIASSIESHSVKIIQSA